MPEENRAWQNDVSQKLGALVQKTADVADQVSRQNGNVAKLWSEMDRVKERVGIVEVDSGQRQSVHASDHHDTDDN